MPHPYQGHNNLEKIIHEIDLVEGFNARSRPKENMDAQLMASRYMKTMTAGSDAHTSLELGRGFTTVKDDLRSELEKGRSKIRGKNQIFISSWGKFFN